MGSGQIFRLRAIGSHIVELPCRSVARHFPLSVANRGAFGILKKQGLRARDRLSLECRQEAHAIRWRDIDLLRLTGKFCAGDIEHGGHDVNQVGRLPVPTGLRFNHCRPVNQERGADAALETVGLIFAQRRVADRRPAGAVADETRHAAHGSIGVIIVDLGAFRAGPVVREE